MNDSYHSTGWFFAGFLKNWENMSDIKFGVPPKKITNHQQLMGGLIDNSPATHGMIKGWKSHPQNHGSSYLKFTWYGDTNVDQSIVEERSFHKT